MKKHQSWMALLLVPVMAVMLTSEAAAKTTFISIATATMGGSYYPIGVGFAEIFKAKVPEVEAKVEVTGGATENPKLVGSGDSDIGFTNANLAYNAYTGTGIYKGKKYDKLRLLFGGVAPGTFHMVTLANSSVKTYADLKGKKVAVGPQGGGGLSMLPDILGIYNLTMNDFTASYLSFDEGVQAVIDKHVDAALVQAPYPAPAIKNIQGSGIKFRLLEMTDAERNRLIQKFPYYNKVDLPGSVYGLPGVLKLVGSTNVVVVNADLSTDLVYQITKAIFESVDQLRKVHPSASSISIKNAVSDIIPLHPGAEKYFKEVGAIK
jgi:TRAP transporter TAXI family solute receptor